MLASKLLAASVPPVQWPAHAHPPLSLARSSLQDPSISKNMEETSERAQDRENIYDRLGSARARGGAAKLVELYI